MFQRLHENFEKLFLEAVGDDEPHGHGDKADDQPAAKLFEMRGKGNFVVIIH
jgi:hypothetical protein